MIERLEKIIDELESINRILKSRSLENAIKEIRIAIKEQNFKLKRKSNESMEHYIMKNLLFNEIIKEGDAYYLEAEDTKLSRVGYRPDIVILRENDAIFIEIERNPRNIIKKLVNIKDKQRKIKNHSIFTGRSVKVVFGVLGNEVDENILKNIKKIEKYIDFDVDVYLYSGENLKKVL